MTKKKPGPKKRLDLKAIHVHINLDDYNYLKDYCLKMGQRGDFSHLIKQAVHNIVGELRKIEDKCSREELPSTPVTVSVR